MTDPPSGTAATAAAEALPTFADVPIGTVIPFAGDCSNAGIIGLLGRKGWMPCDGSELLVEFYADLFAVIGTNFGGVFSDGIAVKFNLPDLTAMFVRGVNGTATDPTGKTIDPDADARIAMHANGNTGNAVGSLQLAATGAPGTPFSSDVKGAHSHAGHHLTSDNHHALDGASFYQAKNNNGSPRIATAGEHTHKVDGGGDPETRPTNVSLFFIIKAA